jgi:hypothetical protein
LAVRKLAPALPQVTAEEVEAAKKACVNAKRLYGVHRGAEKARDAALAQIFFKMGFTGLDEVKAMAPDRLAAEMQKRAGVAFSFDSAEAREFAVLKTWQGCFPAWKEQFLARVGPAIAAQVEKDTRVQYSYAIIDPPPQEDQPNVVYLPKRAGK